MRGEIDPAVHKAIGMDIPRTFPECVLFGPEDAPGFFFDFFIH